MKILLLCPSVYSLNTSIAGGFEKLGHNVHQHNFRDFLKPWISKLNVQIFRAPYKVRLKWEQLYFAKINEKHREVFDKIEPDIVFIYNNEGLIPETIQYFKQRNSRIIFLLGDSPYFTPTNRYYLPILLLADLIISPDSFWADQLRLIGITNIVVDFPMYDNTPMNFREPTLQERAIYNFDLLFVGIGYVGSWGYKRALFASKFSDLNLKVFGSRHWFKWLDFFPELKPHFELQASRISVEQLIIMSKCAKLYPVDANPAILNGIHLRLFDCISHGVLPIVEYRRDHDVFFKDVNLPLIKNYNEAKSIAQLYLKNDTLRESTLFELREFINSEFRSDLVLKRILEKMY